MGSVNKDRRYRRGEIYYVCPGYYCGSEQQAGRPAIIVSNNVGNNYSNTVEVVYLTTQKKSALPTHVLIQSISRKSIALCESVHTVDKTRVVKFLGTLSPSEMRAVDRALCVGLDLKPEMAKGCWSAVM